MGNAPALSSTRVGLLPVVYGPTASLRLSVTTYKSYIVGGMGRDHLNKHVPVTMCGLALGGCACVVALGRPSRRAGAHGVWGVITTLDDIAHT